MPDETPPASAEAPPASIEKARAWVKRHPRLTVALAAVFLLCFSAWLLLFAPLPDESEIRNFKVESTASPGRINWNQRREKPVRIWTPLRQISPLLQQAVVISEDDLFYHHDGYNLHMMKEAWRVNLEKKRYVRGASTITMQLARNAFLQDRSKTILRKARELILTRRLENALDKKRILELYLNVVEWGEGIYGAEAAARYYFGKSAAHLHLGEAAMLAAMLPNPVYFNPFKRMKACGRMQKRVLDLMVLHRVITPEEAAAAGPASLALRGEPAPPPSPPAQSVSSSDSITAAEIEALMEEAESQRDSAAQKQEPLP